MIEDDPSTQIDLALQLLANDVSAVTMVQIMPPPFHQWDTHSSNDLLQSGCFDYLFQNLLYLGNQLGTTLDTSGRPLLDSTTIALISEMGLTPLYNSNSGKDHWPYTSMMLFGSNIRGGTVLGATDGKLTSKAVNLGDGQASSSGVLLESAHVIGGLLTSFELTFRHFNVQPLRPFV